MQGYRCMVHSQGPPVNKLSIFFLPSWHKSLNSFLKNTSQRLQFVVPCCSVSCSFTAFIHLGLLLMLDVLADSPVWQKCLYLPPTLALFVKEWVAFIC